MSVKIFSAVIISILFTFVVHGSVFVPGNCPKNRPIVKDFDAHKYAGLWYEFVRKNESYEFLGDCNTITYTPHENLTIGIKEYKLLSDPVKEEWSETFAVFSNPNEKPLEARWNVSYHWNDPYFENYRILDTDYKSYSIAYTCLPAGPDYSIDEFVIYTRKPQIELSLDNKLISTLAKYYNVSLTMRPRQTGCGARDGVQTRNTADHENKSWVWDN